MVLAVCFAPGNYCQSEKNAYETKKIKFILKAAAAIPMWEQEAVHEKPLRTQLTEVIRNLQILKERRALGKIPEEMYNEFAMQYEKQITGREAVSPVIRLLNTS